MMLCHYNHFLSSAPLLNNSKCCKPIVCRAKMVTTEEAPIRTPQRANGPATILSIGTALPPNCVDQSTYPDFYFRITNSEHHTQLKKKFQFICDNSMIKKRYMHLTEQILKENPSICTFDAPSLDARQSIILPLVSKLAAEAAQKAIEEWGQPKSKITHLIFATTTGCEGPGPDYRLTKDLGLSPSVKRLMIYNQGCFAGGTALRMAKDLAENNAGARVLIVGSECNAMSFRGPNPDRIDCLVGEALFGDGAAAVIVGSDLVAGEERPLFQIVSAAQTIVPESDGAVQGQVAECGVIAGLGIEVPNHIGKHIKGCLIEAFGPLGVSDWNSIFWIAHPGGRAILDKIETNLGLKPEKLRLSRHVLSEYGNMVSASVLFIMDEMRNVSAAEGLRSTGEGLDLGVLFGFGPGLTVETVVLRCAVIG